MDPEIPHLNSLCAKYGHKVIVEAARLLWTIPPNMPRPNSFQFLTEALDMPISGLELFLTEAAHQSPSLFARPLDVSRIYHLAPPTPSCLNGCQYRSADKTDDERILYPHRQPTKARIYDVSRVHDGEEHTLRCRNCHARYGFFWYHDIGKKANLFYKELPELLMVNERVYWTRNLAAFLINCIVHAQCTFEAFAAIARATFGFTRAFDRKLVAEAFYAAEIEAEILSRQINYPFRTRELNGFDVKHYINALRETELYSHVCSDMGRMRGCPYLHIMDGIWKLVFRHCSMPMKQEANIKFVNLPPLCPEEPKHSGYYCGEHDAAAKLNGLPMTKAQFIARKREATSKPSIPSQFSDEILRVPDADQQNAHSTGQKPDKCGNPKSEAPWCRKNLGEKHKMGCWSRGHFVFVHGCGHISYFAPLFRSESMSQVFIIVIQWLCMLLQDVEESEWAKYFVCYDNMCNFNRLRALMEPLPESFPVRFRSIWSKVSKIIDGLHIQNHRQESCKLNYSPLKFVDMHPSLTQANTMAAEQAFSWLSKFKKQTASMNKNNHMFFLHRMIVHRNSYNEESLRRGEKPLAPGRRSELERAEL